MRVLAITALLLTISASAIAAESWSKSERWRGAGWYVTLSSMVVSSIESGPYNSEQACTSALPSEEKQDSAMEEMGYFYACEDLQQ